MNKYHVKRPKLRINDMRLSKGVPLVAIHTIRPKKGEKYSIVKNNTYTIVDITNTHIFVQGIKKLDYYPIEIKNIASLFTLGYAMTTHKMQGSTVEGELQIHEIGIHSNKRLFYTAYSRATQFSNISYCSN